MHPDIEKQYSLGNLYVNQKESAKTFPPIEGKREFNETKSTIDSDSLWYAIYFPQFKNLNEAQKEGYHQLIWTDGKEHNYVEFVDITDEPDGLGACWSS